MTETSDVWTGKASSYDRARPTPPPALLDLLTQLIHLPHPTLVVDLGSGTGLSTHISSIERELLIRRACLMGALISSLLPNRSTGWNRLRPWPRSLGFYDPEDSLLRMTMIGHQHSIGSLIGSPRRLVSA